LKNPAAWPCSPQKSPLHRSRPTKRWCAFHRVGVCGTDVHAFNGRRPFFSYPRILGHELVVEVAVFGATGNPQSMMGAFEYPAHGGRLVFVDRYLIAWKLT
jgi:threonine dehydrogenase-like Zn-dependent dehydrogenase